MQRWITDGAISYATLYNNGDSDPLCITRCESDSPRAYARCESDSQRAYAMARSDSPRAYARCESRFATLHMHVANLI